MKSILSSLIAFSLLGCATGANDNNSSLPHDGMQQTPPESTDTSLSSAEPDDGLDSPPAQTCLVMGSKLSADSFSNPDLYADYEGERYYFCCKECKPKFESDPQKWIAQASSEKGDGHSHKH